MLALERSKKPRLQSARRAIDPIYRPAPLRVLFLLGGALQSVRCARAVVHYRTSRAFRTSCCGGADCGV